MANILVGIFDPEVVTYAAVHEFGDRGHDFMRVAVDTNLDKISDFVAQQYGLVLTRKVDIDTARQRIGNFVVEIIKDMIRTKKLIKTGRMLNSVEARIQ